MGCKGSSGEVTHTFNHVAELREDVDDLIRNVERSYLASQHALLCCSFGEQVGLADGDGIPRKPVGGLEKTALYMAASLPCPGGARPDCLCGRRGVSRICTRSRDHMRMINEFPEHRRADPTRRAEMQVYDQLADSDAPGAAIYEIRAHRDAPEVDFAVWLRDAARFGIQVKGGRYAIENGHWFLYTDGGRDPVQDPVKLTWDAAMSIRATLWTQGRCKVYMVAVLVFPDMADPDPAIEEWAANCRVNVVWGSANLVDRLMEIQDVEGIYSPPNARYIDEEVAVLMPGPGEDCHPAVAGDPSVPDPAENGLTARQVVIQHADVVNVYTVGVAGDDGGAVSVDGEQA